MPKKVLLADDSVTIQKVISLTFATEDYDLVVVGDGDSAVKKAREIRPDLILADVAMPGKNGYEVCEAVKGDPALAGTPVMLLAGTFEPLNVSEAKRVGADDHIVKPFESLDFVERVRKLIETSSRKEPASTVPIGEVKAPAKGAPQQSSANADDAWGDGDFLGSGEVFEEQKKPKDIEADLGFLDEGFFEPEKKEFSKDDTADFSLDITSNEPISAPAPASSTEDLGGTFLDNDFGGWDLDVKETAKKEEQRPAEPKLDMPSFDLEPELTEVAPQVAKKVEEPSFELEEGPFGFGPFDEKPVAAQEEPVLTFDLGPDLKMESPKAEPASELEFEDPFAFDEPAAPPAPISLEPLKPEVEEEAFIEPEPYELERPDGAFGPFGSGSPFGVEPEPKLEAKAEAIEEAPLKRPIFVDSVVEKAGAVAARRIGESVSLPKEEIDAIVKSLAREIIEEVAWQVIPELAEELIKAEISKAKEALAKLR